MKRFNLNYNSVNNYCIRNNLHPIRERKRYEVTEEMIDYLREHTLMDTVNKFQANYAWLACYVRNNNIRHAYKRCTKMFLSKHSCKRSGEAQDMIYELSKTFSYAAIARVFRYTKERIRQICNEKEKCKEDTNGSKE